MMYEDLHVKIFELYFKGIIDNDFYNKIKKLIISANKSEEAIPSYI